MGLVLKENVVNKNKFSFYFSALLAPILTILFAIVMSHYPSQDNGYAIPFFIVVSTFSILIISAIVGFFIKTFKSTMKGAISGILLTYVICRLIFEYNHLKSEREYKERKNEISKLLNIISSNDHYKIQNALRNFKTARPPLLICSLSDTNEYQVSTLELFYILDHLNENNSTLLEREAAAFSLLETLVRRDEFKFYENWIKTWDKLHFEGPLQFIEMRDHYPIHNSFCGFGTTEQLISIPFKNWGEKVLDLWISTGHQFEKKQSTFLFIHIDTIEQFKKIIKAGAKIDSENNDILIFRAYLIYELINKSNSPFAVVDFIKLFIEKGASTKIKTSDGETVCKNLLSTEEFVDKKSQDKILAFNQIKGLFCK
jgi:hypothetical protein